MLRSRVPRNSTEGFRGCSPDSSTVGSTVDSIVVDTTPSGRSKRGDVGEELETQHGEPESETEM